MKQKADVNFFTITQYTTWVGGLVSGRFMTTAKFLSDTSAFTNSSHLTALSTGHKPHCNRAKNVFREFQHLFALLSQILLRGN